MPGFSTSLFAEIPISKDVRPARLDRPLVYHSEGSFRIEVPVGFRTDFASVPWIARWAIPRLGGNTAHAAVIHDWLYATHVTSRKESDAIFYEALGHNGSGDMVRWVMWASVRLFGWRGWISDKNRWRREQTMQTIWPLKLGHECEEVLICQRLLDALGYEPGALDGVFGAQMQRAVLSWEAQNDRAKDGEIDVDEFTSMTREPSKSFTLGEHTLAARRKAKVARDNIQSTAAIGLGFASFQLLATETLWGVLSENLSGLVQVYGQLRQLGLDIPPNMLGLGVAVLIGLLVIRWAAETMGEPRVQNQNRKGRADQGSGAHDPEDYHPQIFSPRA